MELDSSELKYSHPMKCFKSDVTKDEYFHGHQINLIDLKYDCIRYILSYLDFSDLMNVANANVYLKEVACNVFFEKYSLETFSINADRISIHGESMPFISTVESPLNSIGTFFKHFGPMLTKLAFFGTKDEFYVQWVESCIAKYCSGTLIEILLYNHVIDLMSELRQPFSCVESVTIIQSRLSYNISQFEKWFPKMRKLKLIDSTTPNPACIEQHFPHLESLVIWLHGSRRGGFTKSNLSEIIRLNSNIQDLWFQFYSFPVNPDHLQIDQDLSRLIAVNLKNLDRFVWAPDNNALSNCDRITFKKLRFFISEAPIPQFIFRQLEGLELRRTRTSINEIIDFVCRNRKLTKLKLTLDFMNSRQASSDQITKIIKSLSKLSELAIDWRIFVGIDDALKFLSACKSLTRMQLVNVSERMAHVSHQIAQRHIDSSWKIIKTDSEIIFKRKI